jgi:addiction module RelE/StbE family toxin
MINITISPSFKKAYSKRIKGNKKLEMRVFERIGLFQNDSRNKVLNNHYLIGKMKGLYSFSITGDIRVIYQWVDNERVLFLDIGSHNQIY